MSGTRLVVEGALPIDGLCAPDLRALCGEVGTCAYEVGELISTVHGGVVANPDAAAACELRGA